MNHRLRLTSLVACALATLAASPVLAITTAPSWLPRETVASGIGSINRHFGQDRILAYDHHGNPGIAWFVDGDGVSIDKDLKYAKWNGSEWEVATARGAGDAGYHCSLAFSPGGSPYISYHYLNNKSLKVARFKSGFWSSETVDDGNEGLFKTGKFTSIAFNAAGKPTIAYFQWERDEYALKFAWQH